MVFFWIITWLGMLFGEYNYLFLCMALMALLLEAVTNDIIKAIKDTKGE